MHLSHVPSISTLCITGAGGSRGSRFKEGGQYQFKKRSRRHRSSSEEHVSDTDAHTDHDYEPEKEVEEEIEEEMEEEIVPEVNLRGWRKQAPSRPPTKKAVGRVRTLKDIPSRDFRDMRRADQYALPPAAGYNEDSYFYIEFQEKVYNEVIMSHDKIYVPQGYIDMDKIRKNPAYFAEAKEIWEEIGLLPLMKFTQNFDPILVARFYATAHFSTTGDRTITWMTRNERCSATLAVFGAVLGYPDKGAGNPSGFRYHNSGKAMHKDALKPLYMEGDVIPGNIKFLLPTWDILNRVFRDTVAAKVGNFDQIHGF